MNSVHLNENAPYRNSEIGFGGDPSNAQLYIAEAWPHNKNGKTEIHESKKKQNRIVLERFGPAFCKDRTTYETHGYMYIVRSFKESISFFKRDLIS